MKTNKAQTIVLSILMTSLLGVSSTARADIFGDIGSGAGKIFKEAKEKADEIIRKAREAEEKRKSEPKPEPKTEEPKTTETPESKKPTSTSSSNETLPAVNNSILELNDTISSDVHWVMYEISKGRFKEIDTLQVIEGEYKGLISLKAGTGDYTIKLYKSKNIKREGSGYEYFKTIVVENTNQQDTSYLLPSQMVQSEDEQIIAVSTQISRDAKTDAEVVDAIHTYVINTVKYDFEGYKDGSYVTKKYDALSILNKPFTVCAGYSNLFAALVRAQRIRVKVINGKVKTGRGETGYEDHAWNEVFIDGEWKIIDSTWDANLSTKKKYYMPDAATFALDHKKEKEMPY